MKRLFGLKTITILSLFFVFFSAFLVSTAEAQSPSFFFSTPPATVAPGSQFTIDVRVQSESQSINGLSGSIVFPDSLLHVVSISKDQSIVNFWTQQPAVIRNHISFEGIILNPGFQGSSGTVFKITFEAEAAGTVLLNFSEGAILANDGLGTNLLATLGSAQFAVSPGQTGQTFAENNNSGSNTENTVAMASPPGKLPALPVITDYSMDADASSNIYIKGKGEPDALTKITFKDIAAKSLGEQFIAYLQTKKENLDDVLIKNDAQGTFQYVSSKNLVAGVYAATPFLVDPNTNTEKPGLGVQLLVSDSKIVKALVVLINVLGLLIPVAGLGVIIYFIPWYSWRRMRVLKKKLSLEEEKIAVSSHRLEREDKILDRKLHHTVHSK